MDKNKSKIYIHRYLLHSRQVLNSKSRLTEHKGALIRLEIDDVSGYGCLHPWVELGDLSLDELIDGLRGGRISRQVKCALECASVDRNARALGVSLFDGLAVPMSHATIAGGPGGFDRVGLAVKEGFDTVKLKMGRDQQEDLRLVREVHEAFSELRIRLDFNGMSDYSAMEYFLEEASGVLRRQIDFIEDPFPLGDPAWHTLRNKHGVKFAMDRGVSEACGDYDVSVVKPAVNKIEKVCDVANMKGRSVVITSYMDHPVGQSYAAYCAGKLSEDYLGLVDSRCGLMTHGLFEPTDFAERLGKVSPSWGPSNEAGSGLGFDDLLDALDWDSL